MTLSSDRNTAVRTQPQNKPAVTGLELKFKPITQADLPEINRIVQMSRSRTCDYTIGGIFMWVDYFRYSYCIYADTLFIRGVSESNLTDEAFSLPVGAMPVAESIELLRAYCRVNGLVMRFSAIPEDKLTDFRSVGLTTCRQLEDWDDYLYDIDALASLRGKKLSKKRNHVNRFMADNPGYSFGPLTPAEARCLEVTCSGWLEPDDVTQRSSLAEHKAVLDVLANMVCYPFEGAVLRNSAGRTVAFTLGEVIGDTLFVHIEKMDHSVAGAGETVNTLFARYMAERYPGLRYINREEDTGDPGLRKAKLSYHPSMILHKYDITV